MRRQFPATREEHVSLNVFQEIVGELKAIYYTDAFLVVELSCGTLEFAVSSVEADICERKLSGHEGSQIAIIRTASLDTPLQIRHIERE